MPPRKIVIAGGTGFVGRALVKACRAADMDVDVLSRKKDAIEGARTIAWDGRTLDDWSQALDGADALVNLAGEPISQKWTEQSKQRILDSRIDSTRVLCEAIRGVAMPPKKWINASAVGFYGDRGNESLDEASSSGSGFLAEVCRQWEEAFFACQVPVRKTAVRFGMVLGDGGALKPLRTLAKLGLGGTAGRGDQYVSWIHIDDLIGILLHCLTEQDGPEVVNGTAPQPLTNRDFMKAIRIETHAPFGLPAPAFAIRVVGSVFGPGPDLILEGAKVIPKAMMESGYVFRYPDLDGALRQLLTNN